MRLLLCCIVGLSLLSACAPTRYPPGHHKNNTEQHSQTQTPTQKSNPYLGEGGIVKRGNPYQIGGKWYHPLATGDSYDEIGISSWYGKKFHGLKTANGETYNMYAMTAAHTTLPIPSVVRVTNLENGRSVEVRVNDRGPFVKSRLIDLSYAAAKALAYDKKGTTRVRVQTLHSADVSGEKIKPRSVDVVQAAPAAVPKPTAPHVVPQPAIDMAYVQVGAFSSKTSADAVVNKLQSKALHASAQVIPVGQLYRVRLGPFDLDADAEVALQSVQNSGYNAAIIIHD